MTHSKVHSPGILIVDDDSDWRMRVQEIVFMLHYRCDSASSYQEAIKKLSMYSFKLAIVDKSLIPGDGDNEDGVRVLEWIVETKNPAKAIMFTSYGSIDSAVRALTHWRAFDYIEKSRLRGTGLTDFIATIKKVMETQT